MQFDIQTRVRGSYLSKKKETIQETLPEETLDIDLNNASEVLPVEFEDDSESSGKQTHMAPAHGFSASKTDTIGVILPQILTHYSDMLDGINDVASGLGYSLMLANNRKNESDAIEDVTLLLEKQVDALIFVGQLITSRLIRTLKAINEVVPVILVDQVIQNSTIPSVLQDNYTGASKMMKYLTGQGHKRIAYIKGLEYECASQDRYRAYRDHLKKSGIKLDNKLVANGNYTVTGGYEAMSAILARSSKMPTVVFASSDDMAIGAMRALFDRGYKIPDDISIAGFDNTYIASYIQPQLTTVQQNQYNTGKKAGELIFDLIKSGIRSEKTTLLFDQELVIRDSVRPCTSE
jgi:DNA-binding LacI/PurR family transcriptional regulator